MKYSIHLIIFVNISSIYAQNIENLSNFDPDTVIVNEDMVNKITDKFDLSNLLNLPDECITTEVFPNIHWKNESDKNYIISCDSMHATIYKNFSGNFYLLKYRGNIAIKKTSPFGKNMVSDIRKFLSDLIKVDISIKKHIKISGIESGIEIQLIYITDRLVFLYYDDTFFE